MAQATKMTATLNEEHIVFLMFPVRFCRQGMQKEHMKMLCSKVGTQILGLFWLVLQEYKEAGYI